MWYGLRWIVRDKAGEHIMCYPYRATPLPNQPQQDKSKPPNDRKHFAITHVLGTNSLNTSNSRALLSAATPPGNQSPGREDSASVRRECCSLAGLQQALHGAAIKAPCSLARAATASRVHWGQLVRKAPAWWIQPSSVRQ